MKLVIYDEASRARTAQAIANFPLNGKRWEGQLKEADERRRTAQNNLLWKWNSEIQAFMSAHYGQTASAEDWHDIMCRKLRPVTGATLRLPDGEVFTVDRWRSSKAGVKEMAAYLTDLDAYCATLGLLLSHPDDMYREAMARRAA